MDGLKKVLKECYENTNIIMNNKVFIMKKFTPKKLLIC